MREVWEQASSGVPILKNPNKDAFRAHRIRAGIASPGEPRPVGRLPLATVRVLPVAERVVPDWGRLEADAARVTQPDRGHPSRPGAQPSQTTVLRLWDQYRGARHLGSSLAPGAASWLAGSAATARTARTADRRRRSGRPLLLRWCNQRCNRQGSLP